MPGTKGYLNCPDWHARDRHLLYSRLPLKLKQTYYKHVICLRVRDIPENQMAAAIHRKNCEVLQNVENTALWSVQDLYMFVLRSEKVTIFAANRELKQATFLSFCQHGRLPEVNRAVIDGEWLCQQFLF